MADCELLNGGIPKDCQPNIGGLLTTMWMTELSNILTVTRDSPTGIISAISLVSPAVLYPFVFNKGTSSYAESQTFDSATGNSLVTQTIILALNRREQIKKDKIVLLGSFKEMAIFCEDSNGNCFFFGEKGGCVMSTNEGGSGVAKTDANQYVLTFIGEEGELATQVEKAAILAVT